MAYDVKFLRGTQAQYNNLASKDNKTFYFITDSDQGNFYIGSHQLNNAALDVDEFSLAEVESGDIISIKGIKEVDGKIEVGSNKISFAKVAKTGKAEDVTTEVITDGDASDPKQLYAADNVQGVLESLARDLNDLTSEAVVDVEKQTTAESGFASTYVIKQNGSQVGVKINIPLDYLVKSASVKTVTTANDPYTGAEVGDKYIDFVVNVREGSVTDEHLYIPVDDLMSALSVEENAEEVQLALSAANELSASVVKVAASKVAYDNTTSGSSVEETVQAALARIDGADTVAGSIKKAVKDTVETLNADLDAATDSTVVDAEKVAVVTGVTEVNGKLTAVDSIDVDKAGAATRAKEAVIGESSDAKTADTIKGVKNFIGTLPADATADTIVGYIDEKTGEGVDALNVTEFALTEDNSDVISIYGIKEDGGKIAKGASKIDLAKIAKTGKAEDAALKTATANLFTSATDTDTAIAELATALTWGSIA